MTAFNRDLAARIAETGVPLTADLVTPNADRAALAPTKSRLLDQRRTRQGRRGDLGPVIAALHAVLDLLESERWERRLLGVHTTDYVLLMRACYGPLLQRNPRSGRWELASRRFRPDGALEAARAVTAAVVDALGGEAGATVQDIRAAIVRMGGAA
ncbi:hypothetical protein [Streptomyces sp. NPDC060188]|uniref:hypothetical protein n=1 Tax=Streptomyces sp. NPDC060188 TaxID=3347068 RepID=UPI00364C309A